MDCSIIIVSWNAREFLANCLRSILGNPSRHSLEVIVVDNASNDGSPEVVRAQFPTVRLLEAGANLGFARANNVGIRSSTGKYICLINSDAAVIDDCLDRLFDFMESNPDVGMASPQVLNADGTIQTSYAGRPNLWNSLCRAIGLDSLFPTSAAFGGYLKRYWKPQTGPIDVLFGCFWCLRRKALDQVGLLDERFFMYGEDIDWSVRFHKDGWKVIYFAEAKACHYGGASSSNAPSRFYLEMQKANFQYWQKHHTKLEQAAYYLISIIHHAMRTLSFSIASLAGGKDKSTRLEKAARSFRCLKWLLFEAPFENRGTKPAAASENL